MTNETEQTISNYELVDRVEELKRTGFVFKARQGLNLIYEKGEKLICLKVVYDTEKNWSANK